MMLLGWTMVTATVVLTALGQIIVKWQVAKVEPPTGGLREVVLWALGMAVNPWIVLVLAMAGIAAMAWFVAMSRLPLSHAYPVLGVTFPLVLIGSAVLLGEEVAPLHVIGTTLVLSGVVVLGFAATR